VPLSEESLASIPEDIRGDETWSTYDDMGGVARDFVALKKSESVDWREKYLDEEDREDKLFAETPDVKTLAKRFKDTKSAVSQGIKVPGPDAPDDEWTAFHARVRPEGPDKYDINQPDGEGNMPWSPDMEGWFRQTAFESGLSQKQAAAMVQAWPKFLGEMSEKALSEGGGALKLKWGDAYEANKTLMDRGFAYHSTPEMVAELERSGLGNSPELAEHFRKLGQDLAEDDTLAKGQAAPQQVAAKEEAFAEIEKMNSDGCLKKPRDEQCAQHNGSHPDHARALERFRALYQVAHGKAA
jgi:hypothetical protein